MIELVPVTSSQIAAIGYDPTTGELVIRFHGCGRQGASIYSYAGVPAALARGLVEAQSPGSYFHRHIRQGGFPYRRVASGDCGEGEPLNQAARS